MSKHLLYGYLFYEAGLLAVLGLHPRPDLILLLKIIEGADKDACEAVLQYVSDNWGHYETDYEGDDKKMIIAELKFIPVVDHSGTARIVKVSEVSGLRSDIGRQN